MLVHYQGYSTSSDYWELLRQITGVVRWRSLQVFQNYLRLLLRFRCFYLEMELLTCLQVLLVFVGNNAVAGEKIYEHEISDVVTFCRVKSVFSGCGVVLLVNANVDLHNCLRIVEGLEIEKMSVVLLLKARRIFQR